jgi:hypothetical protein
MKFIQKVIHSCARFIILTSFTPQALSATANQAMLEVTPKGFYRVRVQYTVPELKEFREAAVMFKSQTEAEEFYLKVIRGADFYLDSTQKIEFRNPPLEPQPW